MKITDVSIDNRTSVFILVVIIMLLGIEAYVNLPREAAPDVSIPLVIVSTPYFGVSPEDIETLVTQPLEKEINSLSKVKTISSSSFEGYSLIRVEFESGYDINEAMRKVREKVDKAEPKLPLDAESPEIVEINISELPILTVNISGPYGLVKLKDIADDLKDEIENIDGVLDVKVNGGIEREVKVDVDLTKLAHYNIRFDDIINSIQNENKTIPGGSIDVNNSSFLVRVPGEFKKPYIIEDIIVKLKEGKPVYVKDVANVSYGFKDRSTFARINGEEAVSLDISKSVGKNIIKIAEQVTEILNKKKQELPSDLKMIISTDQSNNIKKQVRELENNIFSGLVLVVLVLFFFLGVRNAMFVAIAIPLSMLFSFFVLQALNITLNFVVLFALILALGMLVDNAIVIIENIYKFLEDGHSLMDAAKLGTAEVAWPVFSSTMTTVAAFFPLLFWPGVVGEFMMYIPLTLIITLLASLFVALVINPVFASKYMKLEHPDHKPTNLIEKILHPFNRVTHFFVDVALPRVMYYYEKTLNIALGVPRVKGQKINKRNWLGVGSTILFFVIIGQAGNIHPGVSLAVSLLLGSAIILLFTNNRLRVLWGTLLMLLVITETYGLLGHGVEFFPVTQPPIIAIEIESPSGANIEFSNSLAKNLEKRLKEFNNKDIKNILAVVGSSNNPFDAGSSTPNKSTITIQFVDYEFRRQSSLITTEEIRNIVIETAGAEVKVNRQSMGPPVGQPVNVEIIGNDYKMLGLLSAAVKNRIEKVPGLVDMDDNYDAGRPELRVEIDREKAALYGLNTGLIANAVRTAVNGATASKYRVNDDEFDITVRLEKPQRNDIKSLDQLRIIYNNDKGKTLSVPLISVAAVSKSTGPGAIRRKDLKRVVTVTGNAAEGFNENVVLDSVKSRLADFQLPPGYSINYAGQNEEQAKAQAYLGKAFLVALLLIFLILVIQFNSLSQPLIIMSAVVISLIGVFIGLIFFAMPFGIVMTGIGVISLAGVVVNNNIVLIDYINVLRRTKGLSRRDAVIQAGIRRFRPVTLTAITTILGLIPLTFGFGFDLYTFSFTGSGESADFWNSMGIAVIFGLSFATILTLVIVPVIYSVLDDVPQAMSEAKNSFLKLFREKKKVEKV